MIRTVTVAQLELIDGDISRNLERAAGAAGAAALRGSDLLVLPELWLSGFALEEADRLALAPADGRWETVAGLAAGNRIAVAGSLLALEGGSPRNRLVVHGPDGQILATYDKVHLFSQMEEPRYLEPGDRPAVADLGWCKAGLAVCYDLRFPELFRGLARMGADLVILPAQWPQVRLDHWRTLVRARAIENQVFVVACNRTGPGKLELAGHSMVVDPWGEVLLEAGEAPVLLTVEIDLDRVQAVRERFPVWRDVRPECYGRP